MTSRSCGNVSSQRRRLREIRDLQAVDSPLQLQQRPTFLLRRAQDGILLFHTEVLTTCVRKRHMLGRIEIDERS